MVPAAMDSCRGSGSWQARKTGADRRSDRRVIFSGAFSFRFSA
jgi:hypothetical protein